MSRLYSEATCTSNDSLIIDLNLSEPNSPNQPCDTSVIPAKQTKSQNVYFQQKWYKLYPWIHYVPQIKKIVCFYCAKAKSMGLLDLAKTKERAFLSTGFGNWKKSGQLVSH